MVMIHRLSIVLSCCLLVACKPAWREEDKKMYLESCRETQTTVTMNETQHKAYCDCAMVEIMKHYPTIDEVIINKDSLQVEAALLHCQELATR